MKRFVVLAVALVAAAFFACNRETEIELTNPGTPVTDLPYPALPKTALGPEGFYVLLPQPFSVPTTQPFAVSHPPALLDALSNEPGILEEDTGWLPLPGIPDSLQPEQITLPGDAPRIADRARQAPVNIDCSDNTCTRILAEQSKFLQQLAEAVCEPQGMYVRCCQGATIRTYFLVATPGIMCLKKEKLEDQ